MSYRMLQKKLSSEEIDPCGGGELTVFTANGFSMLSISTAVGLSSGGKQGAPANAAVAEPQQEGVQVQLCTVQRQPVTSHRL